MKPGLKIGQSAEVELVVTAEMLAHFPDESVHDLYSTSALVHHMEWAARKTILPYLADNEEGMGHHVEVSHLMPTLPGMSVRVIATVAEFKDRKITCAVEAFNPRGKIAQGSVTQAIVGKDWLERKHKDLSSIHELSQQ